MTSGGAYLDPILAEEFDKLGIMLRQGYGMTEVGCRISVPDRGVSIESVGRVIDICDVRIENGEIQVKTPTIMLGYYKMPEETAKMFTEDGWFKTGDIGYVTEDRQLFITGRVKNLIILSSGENVSPEAIEKKFKKLSLVSEVVVYGEKDHLVAEIYPDFEHAEQEGVKDIPTENRETHGRYKCRASRITHFVSDAQIPGRQCPLKRTCERKDKEKRNRCRLRRKNMKPKAGTEVFELIPSQKMINFMLKYSFFHKQVIQIPMSIVTSTPIDFDVLKKALNIEIERNDCMRLRFYKEHGEFYQYFLDKFVVEDVPL